MVGASNDDIVRLIPGIQDHTVLEILATEAAAEDLEATLLLLQNDDEGLVNIKRRKGGRLNLLLEILANSELQLRDNIDE